MQTLSHFPVFISPDVSTPGARPPLGGLCFSPKPCVGGTQRGGLGKAHQLFGEQLPKLLNELNEVLAA